MVVLKHEASVSDHVLWAGSMALVVLLTLLVPAGADDTSQHLLVGGVLTVWIGLASLALRRDAPSLAGVAVLSPWAWAMLFVGDFDDRLLSSDIVAIARAFHVRLTETDAIQRFLSINFLLLSLIHI